MQLSQPTSPQGSPAESRQVIQRCLFVGLGGIGQRHLRNLRTLLGDSVEVMAYRVRGERQTLDDQLQVVQGVDLEQKYGVSVSSDLQHALANRPDVVFITNPSSLHVPVALEAARQGCHLFIEKPLSHSLAQVNELVALCEERKLVTCVAYQLRYHPGFLRLRALLNAGALGKLLSVRAEVGEYLPGFHPYEDYRRMYASKSALGGGVTLSQIHELDYLCALFGTPRRVFSMGGHVSSLEIDVDDVAVSLLEFRRADGGPLFVELHQDFVQRPAQRSVTVIGERGKLVWSLSGRSFEHCDESGKVLERQSYAEFPRNQAFLDELANFFGCVIRGEQCTPSVREGALSLEVAVALLASQAEGVQKKIEGHLP
ncbi:MAG TPA: Gfo/Idh/MocA family oxidoreductase [Polyangiaceae bacterium]|nr:Gfo/Idh/MocA family oxidoreductase [Polyangiaceae bacterium]